MGGLILRLIDTAGMPQTPGTPSSESGVTRCAGGRRERRFWPCSVLDGSQALTPEDFRAMDAARNARRYPSAFWARPYLPRSVVDPRSAVF